MAMSAVAALPSEWSETEQGNDEDGLAELFAAAPSVTELLDKLWGSTINGTFLTAAVMSKKNNKQVTLLSEDEVTAMTQEAAVNWDDFHTKLITSIYENRATSKYNVAARGKRHEKTKLDLLNVLCEQYPNSIGDEDDSSYRKTMWRSAMMALGYEFAKYLEFAVVRGEKEMELEVAQVYQEQWEPADEIHCQTLCYIAGALLHNAKKRSEMDTEPHRHTFGVFLQNASVTNKEAKEEGMPVEKIEEAELVQLIYPSRDFFNIILKFESVSRHCLQENRISSFGPSVIADMAEVLTTLAIVDFESFMPDSGEDAVKAVVDRMVEAFRNTKGKDFVRKRRALAGYNFTEAHRATLGIIAQQAKVKVEKSKNELAQQVKVETDKSTNDVAKIAGGQPGSLLEVLETMICPELKAELKARKLRVTGVKDVLKKRLRDHVESTGVSERLSQGQPRTKKSRQKKTNSSGAKKTKSKANQPNSTTSNVHPENDWLTEEELGRLQQL